MVHPGTLFKFFECYDITWVEGDLLTNLAQPSRSSSPVVDALALEFILFLVEPHPHPKTETVLFARQFVESQWKLAEYPAPCSMQRTETLLHTSRYPQPPLVAGLVDHVRQRVTNFAAYTHSGKLQESVYGVKNLSRLGTQRCSVEPLGGSSCTAAQKWETKTQSESLLEWISSAVYQLSLTTWDKRLQHQPPPQGTKRKRKHESRRANHHSDS